MNLPNSDRASVPLEKVVDYLLSPIHNDGKAKHDFFVHFGFATTRPLELVQALIRHGQSFVVVSSQATQFGIRYVVEGPLDSPDGRNPVVWSVWFIGIDQEFPRLITAYPAR